MRACQICGSVGKRVIYNDYCDQPMCLFECTECGHRFVDGAKLNQAWFDNYYLTKYTTDDKPYSDERLNSLADYVAGKAPADALDIGGMDGELIARLIDRGVAASPLGVNGVVSDKFDAVILSHTLEHIYDIAAMMERVKNALDADGLLVVEVPIHTGYVETKAYDYHFQHINKFRYWDLERLFQDNDFTVIDNYQLPDYREYKCWRIAGRYAGR